MNNKTIFGFTALTVALSAPVSADVKSLTSSELTETYIKDSTIIVTPKKRKSEAKKKALGSITISPGEASVSETEELLEFESAALEVDLQNEGAIYNAEEQLRELAFTSSGPAAEALRVKIPTIEYLPVTAELPPFAQLDTFTYNPIGNDLGLSRSNDQLTFSFGNLPGVNNIQMPQGISEGPIQLVPRQGGGFDLTIDIPKN